MALSIILSMALAGAPKIDRDQDGNIITIRPQEGQVVAIFDSAGSRFELPSDLSQPYWLVHPQAWRQAVALAEKVNASDQLVPELKAENSRLEDMLGKEKRLRSEIRIDLENSEASRKAENKALRRSRTQWTLGASASALVIGTLVGVFVVP